MPQPFDDTGVRSSGIFQLARAHPRTSESHHPQTRRAATEEKARRILNEELDKLGWTGAELAPRAKGNARKIQIAQRLRAGTSVT